MADFNSVLSSISSGAGVTINIVIYVLIALLILTAVIGGLAFYFWNKRRYNLRVEIKKVRSDGKLVSGEWGRGLFNSKRGVVYIKRDKIRGVVPMKVFDIRRYLQGEDLLTIQQLGAEDYRPVLPLSFTIHEVTYEDENGKTITQKESVLNIKVDTGMNKAWKTAFENASKRAYSLSSFLNQFQVPIAIAIVLISVFVGFAIIWTKIGSMCGK